MEIPKLKKKIADFLVKEEGSVSKEKLLRGSMIIGGIGMLSTFALAGKHHNNTHVNHSSSLDSNVIAKYDPSSASTIGTHAHHANHGSHNSHSSY